MRRRTFSILLTAVVIACAFNVSPATAQTNVRVLGTWVLDRDKSTFSGAKPDKRTMSFETVPGGIRHVTDSVLPGGFGFGDAFRVQYTFKIDGKDYPADAAMPVSTVSFKAINANTLERTGKYQNEVVETVTYVVSPDGKTLTVKGTVNGGGSSEQIFTKQ